MRITREVGGERENEFNKEDYLTCGQFAKLCQVKKQTLFHYDDIGLLRPALVNDKGYRFYTYRQYETYALIASLKEAGLSLAEIRDYLENRGAKSHLDTLREARERIHTRATYLEQVERAIATEIDRAEEAEALYTEDIVLMQLEELSLLRSPDLDRLDSAELIAAVKSFSAAHEVACAVLDTASLRQGEWDHYSFMLAFEPLGGEDARVAASIPPGTSHYVRPAGVYVVAYHRGAFEQAGDTYQRLLDHCDKNGLELGDYAYEEYLRNELTASSEKDLLTRICIQVSR